MRFGINAQIISTEYSHLGYLSLKVELVYRCWMHVHDDLSLSPCAVVNSDKYTISCLQIKDIFVGVEL